MQVQFISVFVFSVTAGAVAPEISVMIYFDNEVIKYISCLTLTLIICRYNLSLFILYMQVQFIICRYNDDNYNSNDDVAL